MVTTALGNGEAARESHPAGRIGSYEVRRLLGRGATASVYECCHTALGRLAAIKVLHPYLAHDCLAAARFLREGRALSRMMHPNVVQVLDVGQHDGVPYLVMSLVDGNDLGEHLARCGAMSVADTADCILPIVSGIAAAHNAGIVHRDLKPGNVRLTHDHRGTLCPVVLDFGISKLMAEGQLQELTDTSTVLGTANYMSPEQMRSPKEVDARSDLYALGVILYQCATGKRPFEGANAYEVMHAIMTASVPPPSFVRSEIPGTFDSIVLRAMHREASERFPSARELGCALSTFASDPAVWSREFGPLSETEAAAAHAGRNAELPASGPAEERKASWYPVNEHKSWPPSGPQPIGLVGANRTTADAQSGRDTPRTPANRHGDRARSITFDDSRFPLIVVTLVGRLTDVEYAAYLDDRTARLIDRGEVYALVYDGAGIVEMAPSTRRLQAGWINRHRAAISALNQGCGFVFGSARLRGLLTAVHWVSPPPYPYAVFSRRADAMKWCLDRLAEVDREGALSR
jgi:serine/threonine protein kinase